MKRINQNVKSAILFLIIGIFIIPFQAPAAKVDPIASIEKYSSDGTGSTEFLAIGRPSALKIQGKGKSAQGYLEWNKSNLSGELEVVLSDFETGIGMRDRHMKEKYLEVEKYPSAKLKILPIAINEKAEQWEKKNLDYKGVLTIRGKEKEIAGKANIKKDGSTITVDAKFLINIKDFSIDIPSFSGITVAENIDISATVITKK